MSFADFEIRVVKLDEDTFAAIVVDAPGMSFQLAQRIFRISKAELLQMPPPNLSRAVEGAEPLLRFPLSPVGRSEEAFGRFLFNQLLWKHGDSDLRGAWSNFLEREEKRLKLSLAEEASVLPWETLYDNQRLNGFLAQSDISVVRYMKMSPPLKPLDLGREPLRMLVVFADPYGDLSQAPTDQRSSPIEAERAAIRQALEPLLRNRDLEIDWIEPEQGMTSQLIAEKVAEHRYHILHYFGHGSSDQQQGILHLESGRKNEAFQASFAQLGPMLRGTQGSPRLIVLNACELARSHTGIVELTPCTNLAISFLNTGTAMVVAMQYPIRKETAPQFSTMFYRYLHPHLFTSAAKVEEAVLKARAWIAGGPNHVEWITPVVFTRMADDAIFLVSEDRLKRFAEARQTQKEINGLLKEIEEGYEAGQWIEVARKVKAILRKDPTHDEGKKWREKLIQKAVESISNLDQAAEEIYEILKDL